MLLAHLLERTLSYRIAELSESKEVRFSLKSIIVNNVISVRDTITVQSNLCGDKYLDEILCSFY